MLDFSPQTDHAQVLPRAYDRDGQLLKVGANGDIINIDEASASVTYFGWARPGAGDNAPSWRILKMSVSGSVTSFRWAAGTSDYTNIWSGRAGFSYS